MAAVYTLENAIESFFAENTTATRQDYTVLAGTHKVFQFRPSSSRIDIALLDLAVATHGELVPNCNYRGMIGQPRPLCVYEMDKLPGIPYILARDATIPQPPDSVARQQRTVTGMARFFAQSWNNPQRLPIDQIAAVSSEFEAAFARLSQSLPPCFEPVLSRVRQGLPTLFSATPGIPLVLTHGDLCEMNLLVEPETGELTGVIDWAEARVLPFGFALYGLENLLGHMDSAGWHYYDNAQELRELFWRLFWEETGGSISDDTLRLIWTARMAGLLYRYGFVVEGREVTGVVDPDSSSQRYLDAFCTLEA